MIPVPTLLRYAAIGLLLLLVQLNLGYIAIENVTPDLLVIFIVYIAVREGQFAGVLFGFGLGLLFDLISSDIVGTNALSKLLAGFVAGYFYNQQLSLAESVGSFKFLGIMALAALVHNAVYYFFYIQPTDLSFTGFFLRSGVAATLYTTVIAVIVMLVAARKQRW